MGKDRGCLTLITDPGFAEILLGFGVELRDSLILFREDFAITAFLGHCLAILHDVAGISAKGSIDPSRHQAPGHTIKELLSTVLKCGHGC